MTLRSPLVVGAAEPLSPDLDTLKRLEEFGAAAIVLHSVFEEQIQQDDREHHHHLEYGTDSFAEALTYFPSADLFHVGAEQYLSQICEAKENLDIPIIASLNGSSMGGWVDYAQSIEQAGADALELNLYWIPADISSTGAEIEAHYLEVVRRVKSQTNLPLAVKISPFFSSPANMAQRLTEAGADALVLFNRFYQPDIDIEALEVRPKLLLSTSQEMRLPMHWIALLYGRITADLAASSGIHHAEDVVRLIMAGANITLIVSALLRHGVTHLQSIEQDLVVWLTEHEYDSVSQLRGTMSQRNCPNPSQFERVQYMKMLQTYHPSWSVTEGHSYSVESPL